MKNVKTLSQIFTPPEGFVGQICIASALSADAIFINALLTEFTGRTKEQRHEFGDVNLYLMLDQRNERLDLDACPGVFQLQPYGKQKWNKINCMHAKVALMQFGKTHSVQSAKNTSDIIWRLVINTGNWTEISAKNQLEMVWFADYNVWDKKINKNVLSDMSEALYFFKELKDYYAINKKLYVVINSLFSGIETELNKVKLEKIRLPEPRVFTSINNDCILDSIANRFNKNGNYNYVIAGSGFYEQDDNTSEKPKVLKRIEEKLGLSKCSKEQKKLIVNTDFESAGKIVSWDNPDWSLYAPKNYFEKYDIKKQVMHAKFIFVGVKKRTSIYDGKLYLGSGNLSVMGMGLQKTGEKRNIEAGIVIKQSDFMAGKEKDPANKIEETLLCGNDLMKCEFKSESCCREYSEFISYQDPCPLLAFEFSQRDSQIKLIPIWIDDCYNNKVFYKNKPIPRKGFQNLDVSQGFLIVKWGKKYYQIPILEIDCESIKNSIQTIPNLTLDEILSEIESSVNGNKPESFDDEDKFEGLSRQKFDYSKKINEERKYKYQSAMTLVESIAEFNQTLFNKNQSEKGERYISESSVKDWISSLDCKLKRLSNDLIESWRTLEVDFISVLKQKYFAPPCKGKAKKCWDEYIDRLRKKWQLDKKNYEVL